MNPTEFLEKHPVIRTEIELAIAYGDTHGLDSKGVVKFFIKQLNKNHRVPIHSAKRVANDLFAADFFIVAKN